MINSTLANKLEFYFYNSQRDLLKEVEDYWLNNPTEVNRINDVSTSDFMVTTQIAQKVLKNNFLMTK
jgi:hypothetical protein